MTVDKNTLIEKVRGADQCAKQDLWTGDVTMLDRWRVILTAAERDAIVAALQKTPASAPLFQ